jgi:protein TonB
MASAPYPGYLPGGADLAALRYAPKRSFSGIGIVIGLHLLLAWALVSGLAQRAVEVIKAPIQTRLIEEVKPPPPPPPPVLPPPPNMPPPLLPQVPVPVVIPQVVPPPAITPPPPPPPTMAPPPTQTAPPPDAIRAPAPPAPPAPPAGTQRVATPEEIYAAGLRNYVNGIKRYPTSREARQLRPQGTVRIWIVIDRAGELKDSGVETSSGVLLLDNEALRTVRNGHFPTIPAEAYAGQASVRFTFAIEYLPPGN